MHHHADRFVDHYQICIFEHHLKRDVLWTDMAFSSARNSDFHRVASSDFLGLIGDHGTVQQNGLLCYQS